MPSGQGSHKLLNYGRGSGRPASRERRRAFTLGLASLALSAATIVFVGPSFGGDSPEVIPAPPWAALSCPPAEIGIVLLEVVPGPGDPILPDQALAAFLARSEAGVEPSQFELSAQESARYQYALKRDGATTMIAEVSKVGNSWAVTGFYGCAPKVGAS